jgi:D-alanyl-D-alanine carboxypeptidase (penicillin-binding protein 5/6)
LGGGAIRTEHDTKRQFAARLATTLLTVAALTSALTGVAVPAASAFAKSVAPPQLESRAAILVTRDGTVLWSKNPDVRRRPASTIKMLNCLVARENSSLDDTVTVPRQATRVATPLGLPFGQKITVRQLLRLMLVASSNDAAESVAIHIGGTEAKYAKMMNAKAKRMGLRHTFAADPHGLSPKNTSSARDLSVIARALMDDPVLAEMVKLNAVSVPRAGGSVTVGTTNRLLGRYRGLEGIKTGYTDPAGYCFIGAAKRGNLELVSVTLGADEKDARFTDTSRLLTWGFSNTRPREVVSDQQTAGVVPVSGGMDAVVTVHPAESLTLQMVDDPSFCTTEAVLTTGACAPIRAGQTLGALKVTAVDGSLVTSIPLVADAAVEKPPAPKPPAPAPAPASANPVAALWLKMVGSVEGFLRALSSQVPSV